MSKHENDIGRSKWSNIIKVVKNPLGFYTFVAILFHIVFSIGAGFTSGTTRTIFVYSMPVILLILVLIVTLFAYYKPEALNGKNSNPKQLEEKVKSLERKLKTVKDKIKKIEAIVQKKDVQKKDEK